MKLFSLPAFCFGRKGKDCFICRQLGITIFYPQSRNRCPDSGRVVSTALFLDTFPFLGLLCSRVVYRLNSLYLVRSLTNVILDSNILHIKNTESKNQFWQTSDEVYSSEMKKDPSTSSGSFLFYLLNLSFENHFYRSVTRLTSSRVVSHSRTTKGGSFKQFSNQISFNVLEGQRLSVYGFLPFSHCYHSLTQIPVIQK